MGNRKKEKNEDILNDYEARSKYSRTNDVRVSFSSDGKWLKHELADGTVFSLRVNYYIVAILNNLGRHNSYVSALFRRLGKK